MELNEQDISLMDRYLAGQLTGQELADFSQRMSADQEFAREVESQRDMIAAIKLAARGEQKKQLAAMGAALMAAGEIKPYTPTQGGGGNPPTSGGGSSIFGWIVSLLVTGSIIAGIYYFFFYRQGEAGTTFFERQQFQGPVDTVIRRDTLRIERHSGGEATAPSHRKDGARGTDPVGAAERKAGDAVTPPSSTPSVVRDTQYVNEPGNMPKPAAEEEEEKPKKGPTGKVREKGPAPSQH